MFNCLSRPTVHNCFRIVDVFLTLIRTIGNRNGKNRKHEKCDFPCAGFAATGDGAMAGTGDAGASSTAAAGTEQKLKYLPCIDQYLYMVPTKGRLDQDHLYLSGVQGIEPGSPASQAGTLQYLKSYLYS